MQKKRLYYGYIATFLSALTFFGSTGILNNGSANILQHVIMTKGWPADQVTLAYTIRTLLCLIMPIVGWAVTKWGPRRSIGWTTIVTSIFLVATAYVQSPLMFIAVFGVAVSVSMLFNDSLACYAVVNNWWSTKRGRMAGFVNAAGGLGGVLIPPVIAWLLRDYGWAPALWAMGIALLVVTGLPQLIWLRDHPEEVGQEIDGGYVAPVTESENVRVPRYMSPVSWEVKDALRTPTIWLMFVIWGCNVVAYGAVMYFTITKLVMDGWDSVAATGVISALNVVVMIVAVLLGGVVDRIGPKISYFVVSIAGALGCYSVNLIDISPVFVVAVVVLFGIPSGLLNPIITAAIPAYYGPKNFATIQGSLFWVVTLFGSVAASLMGTVLQATGSLNLGFTIASVICLLGAGLALFIAPPKLTAKYEALLEEQKKTGVA